MKTEVTATRTQIRNLTEHSLLLRVLKFQANNPQKGSFILSDVLGTSWDDEFIPFYNLYDQNGPIAGQEMGKLLSKVAKRLQLRSTKENRFGKVNAITRYFFTDSNQIRAL